MRHLKKSKITFAISVILNLAYLVQAQNYPEIPLLASKDFLFSQYQDEVLAARKAIKSGKEPYINFYTYSAQKGDSIVSLSARCSVTQESIATLNHIGEADAVLTGKKLILPTVSALYISTKPVTSVDSLLESHYNKEIENNELPSCYAGDEKFFYIKSGYFSAEERAFFLLPDMGMPLDTYRVTSKYGYRNSPISGLWQFHKGLDMAAPAGTNVMACKSGIINEIVHNHSIYGNFVVIQHEDGVTSLYAHLSYINEKLKTGTLVNKRDVIGKVGMTGLATGPHLHFEINTHGKTEDPEKYIRK